MERIEISDNENATLQPSNSEGSPLKLLMTKEKMIDTASMLTNKLFAFLDPFKTNHRVNGEWIYVFLGIIIIPSIVLFSVLIWYLSEEFCFANSTVFQSLADQGTLSNFLDQSGYHYCGAAIYEKDLGWNCCYIPGIDTSKADDDMCKRFDEFDSCSNSPNDVPCGVTDDDNYDIMMINIAYVACKSLLDAFIMSLQVTLYCEGVLIAVYLAVRMIHAFGFKGLFELRNWKAIKGEENLD